MDSFSDSKQLAKVTSGWKGGDLLSKMNTPQPMRFVQGWPADVRAKLQNGTIERGTIRDPWVNRR